MQDEPDRKSDDTHSESGAPKDAAHREAGDGTLQGSVPAGGLGDADAASESVEPGSG